MNKNRYDTVHFVSWLLCVVTLPWTIAINSICIIVLVLVCLAEGNFFEKWQRIKRASWIWPFIVFFMLHVIGLLYSQDYPAGSFEVEKKLSFLVLPLTAAAGPALSKTKVDYLIKGFTYSCLLIVLISLVVTGMHLLGNDLTDARNFDPETAQRFRDLNPGVSAGWEYFSYVQLGEWIDLHPAYFSMYLVFCVAILVNDMLKENRVDAIKIVVGVLFSFFIVLLAARMAIVSFLLVMLCLVLYHVRERAKGKLILFLGSFLLILFTLIWISPVSRFRLIQEPLSTSLVVNPSVTEWNSVSLRLLEWKASWHQLKTSWLCGVGTGDGQTALQEFYTNFSASIALLTYNSHNQYLQTGLELGAVGVLALLLCFFKPLFSASQPHHLQILLIMIFSVMCITESMLARQKGVVFFALFQSIFLRNLR